MHKITIDWKTDGIIVYKYPWDGFTDSILQKWMQKGVITSYKVELWQHGDDSSPHRIVEMNESGYEIW